MLNTICIVASYGKSLLNFRGSMIRRWQELGYKVVCVSVETKEEVSDVINALGVEYYQVSGSRTGTSILESIGMIQGYKNLLLKIKPDYTFLYMSKPALLGGYAAIKTKTPNTTILINGLETAYFSEGIKPWLLRRVLNFLYRYVCRRSSNVIFQNNGDRTTFLQNGNCLERNSYVVNGSGVDMNHFKKVPLPSDPIVLMVARLLWGKGIREYAEAIKIVKKEKPSVRFMLIGGLDTVNYEALSKTELDILIKEYDLEYYGYTDDVRIYIEQCSIFVLPSYHEGTPRSVLEAMAMGRPIVTTTTAGCRDTVSDGISGFLVPVADGKALAEKILKLSNSSQLRKQMGEESFKRCLDMYEVSKVNYSINQIMGLNQSV